jgi:hypothetical protein
MGYKGIEELGNGRFHFELIDARLAGTREELISKLEKRLENLNVLHPKAVEVEESPENLAKSGKKKIERQIAEINQVLNDLRSNAQQ